MEPTGGETTGTCAADAIEGSRTARLEPLRGGARARRGDELMLGP